MTQTLHITIDGLLGAGATTLAKGLRKLDPSLAILNQGQVARRLAVEVIEADVPMRNPQYVLRIFGALADNVLLNPARGQKDMQRPATLRVAHTLLEQAEVATALVERFQGLAQRTPRLVMVGTAMGRSVAPTAQLRLFLDATPEVRRDRIAEQYNNGEVSTQLDAFFKHDDAFRIWLTNPQLRARPDEGYKGRVVRSQASLAWLNFTVPPGEQVFIDTTKLSPRKVVEIVSQLMPRKAAPPQVLGLSR